jgi:hypothetical protein
MSEQFEEVFEDKILTCHNEGCPNNDIPITLHTSATQGWCGGCNTEITDITIAPKE